MSTEEQCADNRVLECPGRRAFLRNAAIAAAVAGATLASDPAARAGNFLSNLFGGKPSVSDQKKAGDQAAQQILHQYKQVTDARLAHFQGIGDRLVAALPEADQKTWDFRFYVLDSKEINAFALPGGNMFMFTGLYSRLQSDDALAAVTGHEMTHVRKQHWAKRYAIEQQRGLALTLGLALLHAGSLGQNAAGLYDSLVNLKYSRGEEDQADQGGLEDMVAAGYNPEGMIQLFQTLLKSSGNGGQGSLGDMLSDHPLTTERIKRTEQRIAALQLTHQFPPLTPLNYASLVGRPA